LLFSYASGCWCPASSGCVRIAATAMLLASVVSTALRAGSKVRKTCADERASLRASKLACASDVHANHAVGCPVPSAALRALRSPPPSCGSSWPAPWSAANRSTTLALPTQRWTAPCAGPPTRLLSRGGARGSRAPAARSRTCTLSWSSKELPAAEDLEHLQDVEQVLLKRRPVYQTVVQTVVHINKRTQSQRA
jgi:hypothetical protein